MNDHRILGLICIVGVAIGSSVVASGCIDRGSIEPVAFTLSFPKACSQPEVRCSDGSEGQVAYVEGLRLEAQQTGHHAPGVDRTIGVRIQGQFERLVLSDLTVVGYDTAVDLRLKGCPQCHVEIRDAHLGDPLRPDEVDGDLSPAAYGLDGEAGVSTIRLKNTTIRLRPGGIPLETNGGLAFAGGSWGLHLNGDGGGLVLDQVQIRSDDVSHGIGVQYASANGTMEVQGLEMSGLDVGLYVDVSSMKIAGLHLACEIHGLWPSGLEGHSIVQSSHIEGCGAAAIRVAPFEGQLRIEDTIIEDSEIGILVGEHFRRTIFFEPPVVSEPELILNDLTIRTNRMFGVYAELARIDVSDSLFEANGGGAREVGYPYGAALAVTKGPVGTVRGSQFVANKGYAIVDLEETLLQVEGSTWDGQTVPNVVPKRMASEASIANAVSENVSFTPILPTVGETRPLLMGPTRCALECLWDSNAQHSD